MFCRNCGKELTGSPEICPECGAKPMSGTNYCPNCGAPTTELTEICPKCGARVAGKKKEGGTWMPLTAGVLDLVVGTLSLFGGIGVIVLGAILPRLITKAPLLMRALADVPMGLLTVAGVVMILLAVVAIVAGVFAIKRKRWGLVLAGSICGLLAGLPLSFAGLWLGIPAIVFTALGKKRF